MSILVRIFPLPFCRNVIESPRGHALNAIGDYPTREFLGVVLEAERGIEFLVCRNTMSSDPTPRLLSLAAGPLGAELGVEPREEFREIVGYEIGDVGRLRNRPIMRLAVIQAPGLGRHQGSRHPFRLRHR